MNGDHTVGPLRLINQDSNAIASPKIYLEYYEKNNLPKHFSSERSTICTM